MPTGFSNKAKGHSLGDINVNCFNGIMEAGVKQEMTEERLGSEEMETLNGPLSRSAVLVENSPNLFFLSLHS